MALKFYYYIIGFWTKVWKPPKEDKNILKYYSGRENNLTLITDFL